MLSWFSLSIPCISKQFLLECCCWRSKPLSAFSSLTFKLLKVLFSAAISRSFSVLSASNSSNFSLINFIVPFASFSCWVPLIWASFVVVERRCISLFFLSNFFRQSYNIDAHLGESILSVKTSVLSWFSDKSRFLSLAFFRSSSSFDLSLRSLFLLPK